MQRRKQKLIEEAPAPNLDASIREGLCDAALALAREVGYVNAGTAEFIVDPVAGTFHFLEMNARIQVEHGVTELLCGVDLVCEQLRVAAGLPLSVAQEDVVARGCSIELRINAEDPEQKFMPSPGEITGWHAPSGPGVRVDAGVEAGSQGRAVLRLDGRQGHGLGHRPRAGAGPRAPGARRADRRGHQDDARPPALAPGLG